MENYLALFFKELASQGMGCIILLGLSSIFAVASGMGIRLFIASVKNYILFNWEYVWVTIVMFLLSLLCCGFLLLNPTVEVRIVMVIWVVISVVIGFILPNNKTNKA